LRAQIEIMCLFSVKPEYDVDLVDRRTPRRVKVLVPDRQTRVSETVIRRDERPAQYVPGPRSSTPIIRPVTPPRSPARIELVSVEESHGHSPRTSRVSVSHAGSKGKHRGGEDVYIERERIRERMAPPPQREELETYRYVEAPGKERRRSRSITYETNPRLSGRLVERERVVVEDGDRRREYYRRP